MHKYTGSFQSTVAYYNLISSHVQKELEIWFLILDSKRGNQEHVLTQNDVSWIMMVSLTLGYSPPDPQTWIFPWKFPVLLNQVCPCQADMDGVCLKEFKSLKNIDFIEVLAAKDAGFPISVVLDLSYFKFHKTLYQRTWDLSQ